MGKTSLVEGGARIVNDDVRKSLSRRKWRMMQTPHDGEWHWTRVYARNGHRYYVLKEDEIMGIIRAWCDDDPLFDIEGTGVSGLAPYNRPPADMQAV